ncbi:putative component of multidrug efflux pump, AcrB/AcrD/AcrF family [Bradyrhizobium oligotrophicum S58]|uniref:Putative component of multidrug efflux pump, AcrB/AcrD/AcrF family n=1 Tax=Bradyrhizobium oligotrophicum S58 TaxID=1245469 RepID=M4ZLX0_9BRAD|nr:efflux RND transporter periplasmic adaptor subunit [Bradyrhizobium oligotrophicum]BAM87230.1 putative component of multidrug efflux pump, AcrB/AcrD/AcrF family [Bradyrhizobium oligotrophicum S58]
MSRFRASLVSSALLLAAAAPLLAGCNEATQAQASANEQVAVPDVGIVTVEQKSRAIVRELPGRIAPTRVSDVRPRVSGIIVGRLFRQGSEVKAGDPLYRIDPKPFEVEIMSSRAALAKAEAVHERAVQQAQRIAQLFKERAAPAVENEKAISAEREAAADIEARKADLARAQLNLDYATVRAPIDGIVGAAQVSEGAIAVQNETSLVTIQQLDPIYADFTQSVSELNRLRRAFESGDLDQIAPDAIKVRLVLDDGTPYSIPGKLLFSDAKVDAATGQVTLRGEFANPKRELLPGMYVRVRLEQGIDSDSVAVPQQAVQRTAAGGSEVYVIRDDNRAISRPIRTGPIQDGLVLITDGLRAGDKVVVDGFQKFAAGDKVAPQAWTEVSAAAQIEPRSASR